MQKIGRCPKKENPILQKYRAKEKPAGEVGLVSERVRLFSFGRIGRGFFFSRDQLFFFFSYQLFSLID